MSIQMAPLRGVCVPGIVLLLPRSKLPRPRQGQRLLTTTLAGPKFSGCSRQLRCLSKCLSISAAFPRIIASCIFPAHSAPGGMLRALSRAAVALRFSLKVSDG